MSRPAASPSGSGSFMADPTDAAVARAIQRVQDALNDLKALQGKDTDVDEPEPTNLSEAAAGARRRFARARESAN